MKLLFSAAIAALLSFILPAQTPSANYEYRGSGCGWFAQQGNDFLVVHPPVIGKWVEFRTSIPPYGNDFLQFGSFDPGFPIPNGCRVRAYAFPHIRIWIPWQEFQRFPIPNDSSLAGYRIYVQQLNMQAPWDWGNPSPYPKWETSRGVKLIVGY